MRRTLGIWLAAVGCTLPLFFPLTPQVRFVASVLGALAPAMLWLLVVAAKRLADLIPGVARQRQFSLRGLLVLIAVCGVGFAIWDRWLRPGQERRQFMVAVTELGGAATTDSLWVRFSLNAATDDDLAHLASLPGKRTYLFRGDTAARFGPGFSSRRQRESVWLASYNDEEVRVPS